MNKSELVAEVAKNANASKVAVEYILDEAMIAITEAVKKGEKVRLVGFGTFGLKKSAARAGRNPRTGAAVKIPPRKVIKFRPTAEVE